VSDAFRSETRPVVIGLTGPIGCGKSTVARMLASLGGKVIDADLLARAVTAPGEPTLAEIRHRFSDAVFGADGSLDRAAIADVVFNDDEALRDLEAIVHPAVRRLLETELAQAERADAPFVVLEAIKLVEGGLADRCDEVWIVECSATIQRQRLAGRGVSADDADQRIAAQGPDLATRLAIVLDGNVPHVRLSTEGSIEATRASVEAAVADAVGRLG
jgi:dephospho-CoA kinase